LSITVIIIDKERHEKKRLPGIAGKPLFFMPLSSPGLAWKAVFQRAIFKR
jgi:hypothetical protein